ncbi:MAG TPA: hypothetical protein VK009_06745 [Chloroflexota bacterium]|nr:hypothetical protein [Chloroflexota bacterium]
MAWQIGSPYGKKYFLRHAKQTTGIATINRTVLSAFPLLAPPIETQRVVADQLDQSAQRSKTAASALEKQRESMAGLQMKLLRQALMGAL